MTHQELGTALTEARSARGLSLLDVERDTRISTKYLKALEEGRLEELPAPVYARAFTRTYAQYLGLNAVQLVQQLPGAKPEPELPPLPEVGNEATMTRLSASWMVAGVVVLLLFAVGMVMFWTRGDGGAESVSNEPQQEQPVGEGAEQPQPQEPPPVVVQDGVVPDLVDEHVLVAVSALSEAGVPYVVIETENKDVPEGTVFEQSPSAESAAADDTVVTLMVSRG
jgi:cytoskeleton protein RodZ